jgi:hypothetical protein
MSRQKNMQAVYNVPIKVILEGTGCDWSVDLVEAKGWLRYRRARSTYLNEDPWALLERFMQLKTEAEALAFLNETGYFSLLASGVPIEGQGEPEQSFQAGLVHVKDVFEWRDIFRELVLKRPTRWGFALTGNEECPLDASDDPTGLNILFGGLLDKFSFLKADTIVRHTKFSIEFRWGEGKHEAIITASDTLGAFLAAVCIRHLRGERYNFCHRRDCGKLFTWESNHKRKYCCWECGHLVAVRKSRKKALRKSRAQQRQKRSR